MCFSARACLYTPIIPHAQEEQDRKRNHIRENLKDAMAVHQEFAENTLPSLKRAYIRKSQEAEVCAPPVAVACVASTSVDTSNLCARVCVGL